MQTISVFIGEFILKKNRRKQKITGRDLNFGYHKKWFYFLFEVFRLNNDDDIMAAIMRTHIMARDFTCTGRSKGKETSNKRYL